MPLLLVWMLILQDAAAPADTVTDAGIVALAKEYRKGDRSTYRRDFGIHHGHPVVADYSCSDICPIYTTRVIHYDVDPGPQCDAIGGVARLATIPTGIAAQNRSYCVPSVLGREPIPLGGG